MLRSSNTIASVLLVISLLTVVRLGIGIPSAIATPIVAGQRSGFVLPNQTNVSIETADSDIQISVREIDGMNFNYSVNASYSFVFNNTKSDSQSIVLAYVTAGSHGRNIASFRWRVESAGGNCTTSLSELANVSVHGWAGEAEIYHIMNTTMKADSVSVVDIYIEYDFWVDADFFDFSVAVGQSLSWAPSAIHSVGISIMNRTVFENIDFESDENVTSTSSSEWKNGTWHLNMSEYHEDFVTAELQQSIPVGPPGLPYSPDAMMVIVILTVAVGFLILARSTKRAQ